MTKPTQIAKEKTITCKANEMGNYIVGEFGDSRDLDSSIHQGFTVGKRGKKMWWYFIWHSDTGNASIYTGDIPTDRAYIKGDQLITIHFK